MPNPDVPAVSAEASVLLGAFQSSAIGFGVTGRPDVGVSLDTDKRALYAYIAMLEAKSDRLDEALFKIEQWAAAYPADVFPPPDDAYLKKAHEVLTANGMTLDRLSAHAMRHVVEGVGDIARAARAGDPA